MKSELRWIRPWLARHQSKITARTGLTLKTPDTPEGCGTFGCVYLTNDPRWVIKLTWDATEGPLVREILAAREEKGGNEGYGPSQVLPGIVFYKALFKARPVVCGKRTISPYVIVRENVRPMSLDDVTAMHWYRVKSIEDGNPTPGLHILQTWAERFHRESSGALIEQAVVEYGTWMDILEDEFPLVISAMRELFEAPRNLLLADVHTDNVATTITDWGPGYRPPGSVVIHDIGATKPSRDMDKRFQFAMINPIHRIPEL